MSRRRLVHKVRPPVSRHVNRPVRWVGAVGAVTVILASAACAAPVTGTAVNATPEACLSALDDADSVFAVIADANTMTETELENRLTDTLGSYQTDSGLCRGVSS